MIGTHKCPRDARAQAAPRAREHTRKTERYGPHHDERNHAPLENDVAHVSANATRYVTNEAA